MSWDVPMREIVAFAAAPLRSTTLLAPARSPRGFRRCGATDSGPRPVADRSIVRPGPARSADARGTRCEDSHRLRATARHAAPLREKLVVTPEMEFRGIRGDRSDFVRAGSRSGRDHPGTSSPRSAISSAATFPGRSTPTSATPPVFLDRQEVENCDGRAVGPDTAWISRPTDLHRPVMDRPQRSCADRTVRSSALRKWAAGRRSYLDNLPLTLVQTEHG